MHSRNFFSLGTEACFYIFHYVPMYSNDLFEITLDDLKLKVLRCSASRIHCLSWSMLTLVHSLSVVVKISLTNVHMKVEEW